MRKTVLLSTNHDTECLNYLIQAQQAEVSLKAMADQFLDLRKILPIPKEAQCPTGCADPVYLSIPNRTMRPCFACQGTGLHPLPLSEL